MPLIKPNRNRREEASAEEESDARQVKEKSGGGFIILLPANCTPEEAENIKKSAHREIYKDLVGVEPRGDMTPAQVRAELERLAGKSINFRVHIVTLDKNDPTTTFVTYLNRAESFIPSSRKRFIDSAIEALEKLGENPSAKDDKESAQKRDLYRELLKVHKRDHGWTLLDEEQRDRIEALSGNENLKYAFRSASNYIASDKPNGDPKAIEAYEKWNELCSKVRQASQTRQKGPRDMERGRGLDSIGNA